MEEKESSFSGSLGNSDTDSPPPPPNSSSSSFLADVTSQPVNPLVNANMGPTPPPSQQPPSHNPPTVTTLTSADGLVPVAPVAPVAANTSSVSSVAVGVQSGVADVAGLTNKKKRGRPRKYDADGNLMPGQTKTHNNTSGSSHHHQHQQQHQHVTAHVSPPPGFYLSPGSPIPAKKARGRPVGSGGNWQAFASLDTAGNDFTPHGVTVGTGEDIVGKILMFSEKGPRGICILSANGSVSNVTIRQPGTAGGILTYEGRFELLNLAGSYTFTEIGGIRSRTGGLSVSLAGPDGRVIGGSIAGMLTAASPIQIVVGSFMPSGCKPQKKKYHRENTVASPLSGAPDTVTPATPISQGQPDTENRFASVVPLQPQSHGGSEKIMTQNQNFNFAPSNTAIFMPNNNAAWNGMELKSDHRSSPDINLSVPGN